MTDLKKLAEDASARAALYATKDAAKRAVEDLLSSDEERAQKEVERAKASSSRRTKIALVALLALFLVVGLIGMLVSYWPWFLAAGMFGLVGLYGWWRVRQRLAKRGEAKSEKPRVAEPAPAVIALGEASAAREAEEREETARAALQAAEAARRAREAAREAAAENERAVDEELASMKARLKKPS